MPFRIVRNDITKMTTEAIVNTANDHATVGTGCDYAIYKAAGYDQLLTYRKENIGFVPEGDAFITPGFQLSAKYIIHAVSPLYTDGEQGEEEKLRSCYRKSLQLAKEHGIKSISFPLLSTGGFGYPQEEGMRIAVDEIHAFLLSNEMDICLVVFDSNATRLGEKLFPDLEAYIDCNYVDVAKQEEYGAAFESAPPRAFSHIFSRIPYRASSRESSRVAGRETAPLRPCAFDRQSFSEDMAAPKRMSAEAFDSCDEDSLDELQSKLDERMEHMEDTFSEYLMYLIHSKNMENAEVYRRAIVGKKVFSKIKNNPEYHPKKITALCLCVGAQLNLDESKDLLARAGYALSPCDKQDIIFSYFIEHGIYDMIELDIQLEEHGLPCIIE